MSATLQQPPAAPVAPLPDTPRGSLLKAELHRFRARRFIQVLAALGVLGWAAAIVIGLLNFGTPTDADFADAQAQVDQILQENEAFRQQCLDDPEQFAGPGAPEGLSPEELCGTELTADDIGGPEAFLTKAPFDLGSSGTVGATAFAGLASALAFVIGATWIGAEWSSRSLVALLFWVPQRMRVMGTKIAVLVGASLLLGVVAQAGWLAMSGILRAAAGNGEAVPAGLWGALLQTQARAVLLTVLAGLLAFGLTNLVRNTGAALGIGFVYLVIAESAVWALRPRWQPWLLSDNAAALVQDGGLTIFFYDGIPDPTGFVEPDEYFLGHLQSGIYLAIVAAVIVALGAVLFARRDIH